MDSVSQFALGAAVGYATLPPRHGQRHGLKAALWGGACATLPDLDSFYPFDAAVDSFTWHRSYSHSIFVLAAVSPFVAMLLTRLHPLPDQSATEHPRQASPDSSGWGSFRDWWLLVFFCLVTHPLLDCFTVYGTQILLPLSDYPVSWSTIFIIDPLYTLPLAAGIVIALLTSKPGWNKFGLLVSCAYLAFGVLAKDRVEEAVHKHLADARLTNASVFTTPTPFNSLVWRILVRDGDRYFEGFDSMLDGTQQLTLVERPTGESLLGELKSTADVQRLKWFSHGHYVIKRKADTVQMCDQRMGVADNLVFCFTIGDTIDGQLQSVQPAQFVRSELTLQTIGNLMRWVQQRVWSPLPSGDLVSE